MFIWGRPFDTQVFLYLLSCKKQHNSDTKHIGGSVYDILKALIKQYTATLDKRHPLTAPLNLPCLLTLFQKHGVIVAYPSCQFIYIPLQLELCRVQPANVSRRLIEFTVKTL